MLAFGWIFPSVSLKDHEVFTLPTAVDGVSFQADAVCWWDLGKTDAGILSCIVICSYSLGIPGSQPPFLKWWFLLDDDKSLLK